MSINILLLEDDLVYAMHVRERLEQEGWIVYHEVNSAVARQTIEEEDIDVLITDLVIRDVKGKPTNDGGLTMINYVRSRVPNPPLIIAMTGTPPALALLRIAESMKADYSIEKSAELDELVNIIRVCK